MCSLERGVCSKTVAPAKTGEQLLELRHGVRQTRTQAHCRHTGALRVRNSHTGTMQAYKCSKKKLAHRRSEKLHSGALQALCKG